MAVTFPESWQWIYKDIFKLIIGANAPSTNGGELEMTNYDEDGSFDSYEDDKDDDFGDYDDDADNWN